MKNKLMLVILLAFMLAMTFSGAMAQESTTFNFQAAHMVNGAQIDLTPETPVFVEVFLNGAFITQVPMVYKDRIEADLPYGEYSFNFRDQGTGAVLFTCGPYDIDTDIVSVRLQAHEKGPGRVPACYVKTFE